MNIFLLWRTALGRWRMLTLVMSAFILAALALAFLMKPVFRAEVVLAPAREQPEGLGGLLGQFGGLSEIAGLGMLGKGDEAASLATLKSRELTESFFASENLLPVLFESKWDAQNKRWKESDPAKQPNTWKAFKMFNNRVRSITTDRRTGLITLSIEWGDPRLAADWANKLVDLCNLRLKARAIRESTDQLRYLDEQLGRASSVEVRELLYRMVESETKKMAVAATRSEFAFRVIDPAVVPKERERPHRFLILLVGGFLGSLVCAAIVLLLATRSDDKPA